MAKNVFQNGKKLYFEMAKRENGEGGDKVDAIIVTS